MRDDQGWNFRFRRPLNDWKASMMVDLLNTLEQWKEFNNSEDKLVWIPDIHGRFSVGSAYKNFQRATTHQDFWPWKMIWKSKWHDNRMKRGFQLCSRCLFCECEAETINHLFLHCREIGKLWQIFIKLRGISWTMPRNIKEILACWNRDTNQSGHREMEDCP
ncbi:unnamed protein product [Withania somnifera]